MSLTFLEPMVALSSHAQTLQQNPQIEITPPVNGSWRWLDTRSLVFEPEADRFPMATEFMIEVDKSMSSSADLPLAKSQQWQFATPPLDLEQLHPEPDQPSSSQPVLVLVFNQPFDTQALLPFIVLTAEGKESALRSVTKQEVQEDSNGAAEFIKHLETKH